MAFLKNTWYVAAWSDELTSQPLARTFLDEPVVLFRTDQGVGCALRDRCGHRFAKLSVGKITGSAIECRYHGLRFDGNGTCIGNPHGPINQAGRIRSYVVHEAHRAAWIWMGDSGLADPNLIPDLSFLGKAPESAFSRGYIRGRGNYELFTDNILDLSHADFLHPTTLGGNFTRTRAKVTEDGDRVAIHWNIVGEPPSPFAANRLPPGTLSADSWTEVEWSAPAVMVLRNGVVAAGEARSNGKSSHNVHIMTPETAGSTHYFYAATRNYDVGDLQLNARIAQMRDRIFATEDEPMIAGQQTSMGDANFWDLKPALMRIDEGPVRARRILARLIAAEHGNTSDDASLPPRDSDA
jgi:phenylpropionate dioxygenase-like ring-hydroxylating dioxygenase large terminal subunit